MIYTCPIPRCNWPTNDWPTLSLHLDDNHKGELSSVLAQLWVQLETLAKEVGLA